MQFRAKTILGVAAIEMVLLAILIGSALTILRESNEAELIQRISLGSQLLAAAAKDAVLSQDLATLNSLVNETMSSGQVDIVRILDAGGAVLASRGDTGRPVRTFHPENHINQVHDGIFDHASPILAGGIAFGEVQLSVSTLPIDRVLSSARRWAAGIAGIEMLLVALFSWLLGSYLLRQLVQLRAASQHIAGGNFDSRITVTGNDELAQTAIAFNHMAAKIGDSHAQLREEVLMRRQAQSLAEQAKAHAQAKSEQLNIIFTLSPDGFASFDSRHCINYVNPAFTRMTRLTEEDVQGLNEADFSARLSALCKAESGFTGLSALRGLHDKDGAQRQKIELSADDRVIDISLREAQGGFVSQILYLRDITHETYVDKMKSEFLTTAAHELRTPMVSIFGYTEILLAMEFTPEERRDYLQIVYKQSGLMVSILDELLDLARIEARQGVDFDFTCIDLNGLLPAICARFPLPQGRCAPELPAANTAHRVLADRDKLSQAITHVLSNAYKFSPGGGFIRIEYIEDETRPALIGIRICDQGIGMETAQLDRIFERFYRADSSGKLSGTGLGMSIAREIIELHQGHISVQSEPGTGTSVTLYLPVMP